MRFVLLATLALSACVSMTENVAPPGPLAPGQTVRIAIENDGALVEFPLVTCAKPSGLCVNRPDYDMPEVTQTPTGYKIILMSDVAIYALNMDGTGTIEAPEVITPLVWFR
jgi:hypothetical protein